MTTYQQRPQIQGPEGGLTLLGDDKSMTITNKIRNNYLLKNLQVYNDVMVITNKY